MRSAIALRTDFTGSELRQLARYTRDANQARRLLALAVIYDGGSRSGAARVGGVGLQIIRDWVLRFNAEGPEGLIDRKAPGPMPRLNAEHRAALAAAIESGPIPAIHGVVRWRLIDLGGVPCRCRAADAERRTARAGLSQAHRPAASPRPGGEGGRAFFKRMARPVNMDLPRFRGGVRAWGQTI